MGAGLPQEIIRRKRDGAALSEEEVRAFVEGVTQTSVSDAQIADLTFQVGAIRSWNMLNASFHTQVPETPYTVD